MSSERVPAILPGFLDFVWYGENVFTYIGMPCLNLTNMCVHTLASRLLESAPYMQSKSKVIL